MSVDLTFRNNQNFLLVYNVSQWALLYDLSTANLRMQIRYKPGGADTVYAFANFQQAGVGGTISYQPDTQLLLISASYDDVRVYMPAGIYAHDLTVEIDDPISGLPIIIRDIAAGSLTINDGVTLQ